MWKYSLNERLLHLQKETLAKSDARRNEVAAVALADKRMKPYMPFVQVASICLLEGGRRDSIMCANAISQGASRGRECRYPKFTLGGMSL